MKKYEFSRLCFQIHLIGVVILFLLGGALFAGTITVNSVSDGGPANDSFITLREALLIARGDRTPYDHPDPDIFDEKRHVNGTVGAGISDTINVVLGPGDTINLVDFLPPLDDAQDSIQADSNTVVNGSALSDADSYAFDMTTNNHAINGLTLSNFPGTAIRISVSDISINATLIRDSGRSGIDIRGPASGNTISNCVVDGSQDFGIVISTGANGNTIGNSFIYSSGGAGIWIYGQGTDNNTVYACGIGLKEPSAGQSVGESAGNGGDGVKITDGAKNNRLGNPDNVNDFTYISNNTLGGIEIKDAGTDGNILHSLWLGVDKDDHNGVGNGSLGHGIEIWNGAKNTQIGIMNERAFVVLAGHNNSPIYVHGVGTNGTNIQRTFIGGVNPNIFTYPRPQMSNIGHGLEISDGVQDMVIGGEVGFGFFVDFLKSGLGTRHGVYINGDNATTPIKNITFKAFHLGRERPWGSEGIIDGDAIHITGNVDGVDIGELDHDNQILAAKGYGITLDGPDVRNVRMFDVVIGEDFGQDKGCEKGGILITNGAHDITIGYEVAEDYHTIGYNKGHGIHIDARNTAPYNIDIVNYSIGVVTSYGSTNAMPNQGSGIFIEGPEGPPLALTGISIGVPVSAGLSNTISGNMEHGIHLKNVAGVKILNNRIGTPKDGSQHNFTGNVKDGILLENCKDIIIGDDSTDIAGNQISGNKQAGIRFKDGYSENLVQQNLIGTTGDGQSRFPNNEAGIVFEAPGPDSGQTQIIGGTSSLVDDSGAMTLDQGNVISGNDGPGILMQTDGEDELSRIRIYGNLIGVSLDGKVALENDGPGVKLAGEKVSDIVIGDETDATKGNVISGNKEDGVRVEIKAGKLSCYKNKVGTTVDPDKELPNERHGFWIGGGGENHLIEDNIIRFNKENGIRVSEASTQVKITKNSIHRNEKEGIYLTDSGNADIKAPVVQRIFSPGSDQTKLICTSATPNADVEVYVDPLGSFDKPGYFGQGKTHIMDLRTDAKGAFTIPTNFADNGIITATITDGNGNTSAFSPIADGHVIQVVKTDDDLLVANKRTLVRLYGNTGQGADITGGLSGSLSTDGSGALSAIPNSLIMRPLFAYNASTNARLGDRRNARNSLNFYIDKPAAGMHEYEITLKEGTRERGKINLGSYEFKEIDSFSIAIVPIIAPKRDGTLPKPYPSLDMAVQAMNYFSSVYPFDPANFLSKMKVTQLLNRSVRPHTSAERLKLYKEVEKIRARTKLPDGSNPRFAAGLVSVQTRFDPPGVGGVLFGSTFGSVPQVIGMIDRNPVTNLHNGETLLHEIGHTAPFNLGDTYTSAGSVYKAVNPVDPMPSQANNNGNFILENEFAFSPLNNMQFFNLQGPVFSDLTTGNIIYDFMGSTSPAWADPVTYSVLYKKSLGGLKSSAAIHLKSQTGYLLVQGVISSQDVVTLEPLIRKTQPTDMVQQQPVGAHYIVELLDGADQVLDAADVWMLFEEHWSGYDLVADEPLYDHPAVGAMPFSIELNDFPEAAKIIVRKDGQILAVLEISANAPTVTLLAPHGPGNLPDNEVLVSWSADDADPGDAQNLTFDILYTPDDSDTVLPVALGLSGVSSVTVPTDELPSGHAPRFIISASDGWHETTDQSDPPLTLVDRNPQVKIMPLEDMLYDDVVTILLATAYDAEDGFILEDTVVWMLDDEPLVTGYNPLTILPAGTHVLEVTATDSKGNEGSDQLTIEVKLGPNSTACRVGMENFASLAQHWLSDAGGPTADMDGSGTVDFGDLLLLVESWGGLCPE